MAKRDSKIKGISYAGLHMKMQKKLGKPSKCDMCKTTKDGAGYEWANKDHKYSEEPKDWMRVCKKCHEKYDAENNYIEGDKRMVICKTCGIEMRIKPSQGRKKMCTKCSYELKKIRSSAKYWEKKDKGSTRHLYWEGRLSEMLRMLNKK
ncbi:MAG: hypothetical protein PHD04_04265 [Candidatus Pacebacteria bacterium]|nr:hypothetical protein [Candidatus Paceibacterota bacterium]